MIDPTTYAGLMSALSGRLKFPLSDATNAMYYKSLSEKMTTEEFEQAAQVVFDTYDDFGFPTPAVFLASLRGTPVVDGASILRQISKLGTPAPHGYLYPNVSQVREKMGDMIANAYATAGAAPRCFADDETARSIAARDFQKAMEAYSADPETERPRIEGPTDARALTAGKRPKPVSVADLVEGAVNRITNGEAASTEPAHV